MFSVVLFHHAHNVLLFINFKHLIVVDGAKRQLPDHVIAHKQALRAERRSSYACYIKGHSETPTQNAEIISLEGGCVTER